MSQINRLPEENPENKRKSDVGMYRRALDIIPEPVQLLEAIYEKGTLNGFSIVFTNKAGAGHFPEIEHGTELVFGKVSGGNAQFIEQLKQVVQTNKQLLTDSGNEKRNAFRTLLLPFENGVLVIKKVIPELFPDTMENRNAINTGSRLKDSVDLLQAALDFPLFGVCVYKAIRNAESKIVDFEYVLASNYNQGFKEQQNLTGKSLLGVYPESLASGLFARYVRVVEQDEMLDSDDKAILGHEKGNWIRRLGIRLGDGLVTSWIDITAQKHAEEELKKQANLIRGISEASADILYIMDIDTREVLFTTRNIAQQLGFEESLVRQMKNPLFELMHDEDIPAMIQHVAGMKTAAPGEIREIDYRMKHADGSLHFFRDRNTVFKRDAAGIPVEKLGISQDITTDRIWQADLAKHHSLLRQSEELAESGSWEYDCETGEFLWSDGMYRLFEIEKGTPVRPSVYLDFAIPEDQHIAQQMVDFLEDDCDPIEVDLRIKPGKSIKTLHIKTTKLKDHNRNTQKILGIDMDISTARTAEEKIQALNNTLSTKNRELEALNSELKTFNNIAANDYKETLRNLYIHLENVIKAEAAAMSDTGKANLRKTQMGIQKMKLLTDDLVSFSRLPMLDNNIATVNLNDILEHAIADLEDKIHESGAVIHKAALPVIQGMPVLLSLLFHHLLDNAIKFREAGKHPVITVSTDGFAKAVHNDTDTRYHTITIVDNGIGFDQKFDEKLFTIFFRLHERSAYRGSGIGLAVCRKIMALHGGYISAQGEPGKGATISCYFPV